MPDRCKVSGCKTVLGKGNSHSLFRIPKEVAIKNEWLKFLKRDLSLTSTGSLRICSRHFHPRWFKKHKIRTRLRQLAIPTLNPPEVSSSNLNCVCTCHGHSGDIKLEDAPGSGKETVAEPFEFVNCTDPTETNLQTQVEDPLIEK